MATVEQPQPRAGDLLARVDSENIEFVRFWFTDIFGVQVTPWELETYLSVT